MRITVLDTETTGIVRDFMSPDAPHMAAVTLLIYNTVDARVEASFNTLIRPDGWEMPPEAGMVNGLDNEQLELYGLPLEVVLPVLVEFLNQTDTIVAHNVAFDVKVLASVLYRNEMLDALDALFAKETFCTMNEAKPIVQAKNKRGALKYPKLTEAYEYFFEKPLDNAHSANADAVACLEIYLALQAVKQSIADAQFTTARVLK